MENTGDGAKILRAARVLARDLDRLSFSAPVGFVYNPLRYARAPEVFRREAEEKILKQGVRTIFIDEVQRLPDLLNEVHLLIEKHRCRFIPSGSSARKPYALRCTILPS